MDIYKVLFFTYGLLIGSFLNVCIYRLPLGMNVALGHSICPSCRHTLSALDLVPVFSYLFLHRRCRYCKAPISPRYAFVELLTAVLFTFSYIKFAQSLPQAILACLFFCILIVIAFIDYDTQEVPDKFHVLIFLLAITNLFLDTQTSLLMKIIGFFAISVPMLLLAVLTGGFGGADIKLMAVAGLYIGALGIVLAFFIGAFLGVMQGICVILLKTHKSKKTININEPNTNLPQITSKPKLAIAFCPSLCAGIAISLFFSKDIIGFYLSFF